MSEGTHEVPAPSFYAIPARHRRPAADWWVLLHPPYTLWHLSYVAIGAAIAPRLDGGRLAATLLAFFLAVGLGAHALDELKGRPLRTEIPGWLLASVAVASLLAAVGLGLVGIARIGAGLSVFIVVGVALNCGYNLELFDGRLHNDFVFALAWGSFPVLTAYYAQAATLRVSALIAALAAYWLSTAQRALSTPARALRRRIASIEGTVTYNDGHTATLSRPVLLAPLETALKAAAAGVVALAASLLLYRFMDL